MHFNMLKAIAHKNLRTSGNAPCVILNHMCSTIRVYLLHIYILR